MYLGDEYVGGAPLEFNKVEVLEDQLSHGTFVQMLVGAHQIAVEYDSDSLDALEDLSATLYSYATSTTMADDWDDVDINLGERHYYDPRLKFGFVVDDFDVNKLALDFYTVRDDEPFDLAVISFTGEELKGFAMHLGETFELELDWGDPEEAAAPAEGANPFDE